MSEWVTEYSIHMTIFEHRHPIENINNTFLCSFILSTSKLKYWWHFSLDIDTPALGQPKAIGLSILIVVVQMPKLDLRDWLPMSLLRKGKSH